MNRGHAICDALNLFQLVLLGGCFRDSCNYEVLPFHYLQSTAEVPMGKAGINWSRRWDEMRPLC